MLNNSENGRHSCLHPDFSGKVYSVSLFGKITALKYIYTKNHIKVFINFYFTESFYQGWV